MNKKFSTIFQYTFFTGLGIFLIWWQFSSMKPDEKVQFATAIKSANYLWILPVIIMSILSHISRAQRWKIIMEPLGYKPKLSNAFFVTMVGYLVNSFLPRVGEVAKCTLLAKYENQTNPTKEKLKTEKLIGTILFERMCDMIFYLLFIGLTLLIEAKHIGGFLSEQYNKTIAEKSEGIGLKIGILLGLFLVLFLLAKWLNKKYANIIIYVKIKSFLQGLKESIFQVLKLKKRGWFLFHTLAIWAFYLLQVYIGFKAMEATQNLHVGAAFSVLTMASLAMILTPGGIGAFPLAVAQVLVLYGINETLGISFGWMMWGATTILVLIIGLISYLALIYFNPKKYAKS